MDAKTTAKTNLLKEELEKCLAQATAVACELQTIEQGNETPHYDDIELPAHALGQRLSRMIQTERSCEVALGEAAQVVCPACLSRCKVEIKRRTINSMDGPIDVTETVAKCRQCRRSFFPSAELRLPRHRLGNLLFGTIQTRQDCKAQRLLPKRLRRAPWLSRVDSKMSTSLPPLISVGWPSSARPIKLALLMLFTSGQLNGSKYQRWSPRVSAFFSKCTGEPPECGM